MKACSKPRAKNRTPEARTNSAENRRRNPFILDLSLPEVQSYSITFSFLLHGEAPGDLTESQSAILPDAGPRHMFYRHGVGSCSPTQVSSVVRYSVSSG